MECVFIRHGIAVEPEVWQGREYHRPLTAEGRAYVLQAAAGLVSMKLSPTHVLTSPFTRALETATLIQSVLCPAVPVQTVDALAVSSTPARLFATLRTYPSASVVLCVGHEPLMGAAVAILLCGRPCPGFVMKKAGAAFLQVPEEPRPAQGILRWWLQPKQLRALGQKGS